MAARPVKLLVAAVMNVLIVVAILLTLRLVVEFFGSLASQEWGRLVVDFTRYITIPLGLTPIETPYGGVFDLDAVVTILGLLVVEWMLSIAHKQS